MVVDGNMRVIALHGQGATPEMLREDMGDPPWVDYYLGWRRFPGRRYALRDAYDWEAGKWICGIKNHEPIVWVGYSLGCDVARYMGCVYRDQTAGYVLYEGPCFSKPCGDSPAVIVWNRQSRRTGGGLSRRAAESVELWGCGRKVAVRYADGRHVRREHGRLAHDWDRSQNDFIAQWIASLKNESKRD